MSPFAFLCLLVLITACVALLWRLMRIFHRWRLQRAAVRWRMRYCAGDQFRLATRLESCFPVIGASDLRVRDLMYSGTEVHHCYIFTVEFTVGLLGSKRRRPRVIRIIEPRSPGEHPNMLEMAPVKRSLLEQYRFFTETAEKHAEAEA